MNTLSKPLEIQISSGSLLILSKTNAKLFHEQMKEMIKDTGYGLFEYVETINFFTKLNEVIKGKEDSPADKEFIDMIRDEVKKHNGKFTSARGVKFENMESGSKYDYSKCGDVILESLEVEHARLSEKIKERKEFLKTVPSEGLEILIEGGELIKIYPPSKSSTSTYKVTLPKN